MERPLISVITPTYNRARLVERSVRSALTLMRHARVEVVVVDDASTDDTEACLGAMFAPELAAGTVRYERLQRNLGVSRARNHGATRASGEWLLILDSDDTLIEGAAASVVAEIRNAAHHPFIFFRCVDSVSGALMGAELERGELPLSRLLSDGSWGECLPAIRRTEFLDVGFPIAIRGGEGLTYLELADRYGAGLLTTVRARAYDTQGLDRLCSPAAMRGRGLDIARFHLRVLRRYWRQRPLPDNLRSILASAYHAMRYASSLLPGR